MSEQTTTEEEPEQKKQVKKHTKPRRERAKKDPFSETERKGKRIAKLERLRCWPQVKAMIENSRPITDMVHYIQEEQGEYLEIKPLSLKSTIYQWIDRNQHKLIGTQIPTKYLNLLDSTVERVDPLDAVNMLFAIHMDRVMLDYAHESKNKKSQVSNTQNLKLANEMVRTMSYINESSIKHKVAVQAAKDSGSKGVKETFESIEKVKRSYAERFGSTAAAIALNPESRTKVHSALSRIKRGDSEPVLKLLEKNSKTVKDLEEQELQKEAEEDQQIE